MHPAQPKAGEPLTLSLHVGNFQGPEFDGPLTLTFHQEGAPAQVTRTLTRQGVNWHTELVPDTPGIWELEVRYRHTHLKVLTARVPVMEPPLPRGLGWGMIIVAAGTALGLGVRGALRRIRGPAPETQPAPADAPPGTQPTPGAATDSGASPTPPADSPSGQ
ncbi:hypothetical protein K8638_11080 [Myxococcus sp. RHST-1-4]|nr:hypothetical protein [Myxococcus sp. RHSTA-1-4]